MNKKKNKIDKDFIKANAIAKKGDIISPETGEKVQVENMTVMQAGGKPKIVYHGIFINKKTNKPFKNGKGCSICNNKIVLTRI